MAPQMRASGGADGVGPRQFPYRRFHLADGQRAHDNAAFVADDLRQISRQVDEQAAAAVSQSPGISPCTVMFDTL
jgi:hypothetical protein